MMKKKAVRVIRNVIRIPRPSQKPIKQRSAQPAPAGAAESAVTLGELVLRLIAVDRMLCQSEAIATLDKDDATKLYNIISTHHVGLENMMRKYGIVIERSEAGAEFDPEFMIADPRLIDTADPALHGTVALSVSPAYYSPDRKLLGEERVMLYNLKEEAL